ncbi:MAG: 23S rRNA (adenine(2503)-C(2))-methyltransferase RlmN, partial [Bacteroidales bacterium]|nr:23S rRNA (adenine(2503)-C(2))-methyltransferase RlmN [Bacteroidales bacterium]
MKSLLGLSLSEIQEIVNQHGLPKFTAKQLTEWLYKKHCGSFDEMTNLSKSTRQLLSENYTT